MTSPIKILIYGYGNSGRQDDGLGIEFIKCLEKWVRSVGLTDIELASDFQLKMEDAYAISDKDVVVFVDASDEPIESFSLTRVEPSGLKTAFTTHAASASFILSLCNKLYKTNPITYLLHIKGYEWDFKEELTEDARLNLEKALTFIQEKLKQKEL